ncbi:MAG: NlpC/P60 family protein [Microthrixaceae bacterium]
MRIGRNILRYRNSSFRPRVIRGMAIGATLALSATLIGVAPGSTSDEVGAQNVESLRAAANRAADELSKLRHQSDVLNEKYLQLQEDISALKDRQAQNQKEVQAAQQKLDKTRSEASSYLVEAYVGAGGSDTVVVGSSDPNEALNQKVLLSLLKGDRVELADDLEVTKSDLQNLKAELDETAASLEARRSEQSKVVSDLESSVANQRQILEGANQELNQAIQAEQARREAEAAARAAAAQRAAAAAAAQRQAAAQAERVARQQTPNTAAPTPSRPGAPAPSKPEFVPPPVVSAPSSGAAGAIAAAKSRLGTPYRWGGTTPAGFDCSGLMLWSWAQVGVRLPRTSGAQKAATQRISFDQLQPGDLVFSGNPVYHVGMYIGGGQMIHSPSTGDVVKISAVRAGGGTSYGRIG